MKYSRYTALLLILLLTGCLTQTRQELAQCTAQASARYPATGQIPMGQPFKDIYACMWNAGYDLDSTHAQCRGNDYATNIDNPVCYRPRNFFMGYFYDMASLFR